MKRFILIFFAAFIIMAALKQEAMAQCEGITITGQGIDIKAPLVCGDVEITLDASYTFAFPVDPAKVQVQVFWKDRDSAVDIFPAIETSPGSKTFKISQKKVYVAGNSCSYEPETYLIYDGKFCASSKQSQRFASWSTDDTNPGPVVMDPVVAEFCPSSPISNFVFYDNTTFNCNINIEPDKPNRLNRWVQFIYNTDPTAGNLVRNLSVNGTNVTDGAGNFIQQLDGPIEEIIAPADGPVHFTLPINAPAYSPVGSYFEVTMRNWNICNPYDDPNIAGPPADLINGDHPPKITTSRILIVAPPEPVITTKNKNSVVSSSFCPNDRVRFEGKDGKNLSNLEFEWTIYDAPKGSESEANKLKKSSSKNFWFEEGFPTAGKKAVKLRIRRKGTFQDCWTEVIGEVEVFNSPTVTAKINEVVQDQLDLCFDPVTASHSIKYAHDILSGNSYTHQYQLFKRNSTSSLPDSMAIPEPVNTVAAGTSATAEYNAIYTRPGQYRIWLVAIDEVTKCETVQESITNIYDKPVVDFSAPLLCEGQPTKFENDSKLNTIVNGDGITGYEWDFGDGSAKSTSKEPTHDYGSGGTYNVSLTVTTKGGCPVTFAKDIVVNKVPEAELAYNYTTPICPGTIEFENLSKATNSAAFGGDDQVLYKIFWSEGTLIRDADFEGTTRNITFNNTTDAELTYHVWLQALAVGSDCKMFSDSLALKVKPGAKADFNEVNNYSIFNDNCSPVELVFEVDQNTLDIGGESHRWIILKGADTVLNAVYNNSHPEYIKRGIIAEAAGTQAVIYTVSLIVEKTGKCVQTAEHKYRVNPRPVVAFDANVTSDCDFTYVHVKVNSMAGVKTEMDWQISPVPENKNEVTYDDDFILRYARPNFNDPNAVDINLGLNQENYFGCWQDQPLVKIVKNNPKVIEEVKLQVLSDQTEGCSPLEVKFENITDNAPADTKYELYVKHGIEEIKVDHLTAPEFSGDIKGVFTYSFKVAGTYTVSLKATVEESCELFSPSSVGLVVNSFPVPDFELINPERCSSFTTTIINNTQGSAVNHWSIVDLSDTSYVDLSSDTSGVFSTTDPAMIESFVFTADNLAKAYEVRLVAESDKGCLADTIGRQVKVYPAATASFTIEENSFCSPYEVKVKNTSLANNPAGSTYTWSWGNGTNKKTADETITYTYTGTISVPMPRDITLTVSTPDGCSTSYKETIVLQPKVTAAFTSNVTEACSPLVLYLYDNSQGEIESYHWEITEKGAPGQPIFTSSAKSPNDSLPEYFENNGTTEKIYVVRLRVKNAASGCEDTQTKEIKVLPEVKAAFGMDIIADNCSATEVAFTNLNIQPGIAYSWNWGNGEPIDTAAAPQGTQFFDNSSTSRIKDYVITLSAYNPVTKCTSKTSQTVRVNPTMKVNVAPDKEVGCSPLHVSFVNNSENVQKHEWYFREKGSTDKEEVQTTETVEYTFVNLTPAVKEYEVVYKATSPTGCPLETIHTITVYPAVNAEFTTHEAVLTQPDTTFLITPLAEEASGWNYHWDFGDGGTSTEYNPISHSYSTYGTYTITYTVSNEKCSDTFQKDVFIKETMPLVEFESIPVSGCWPLVVSFVNKSKFTDTNSYKWDFGDGEGTATSINPSYTYHKPGQYTVTLSAENSSGQTVTTQHSIVNVYERPRISFELRETEVFVPGDPLYVANYTVGASNYLWDFGDGTTYEEFEPVHYYKEPGEYTISLIASNEWGCADTLVKENVVSAKAGGKLKIPNAFTPGLNGSQGGDISSGKNNDVFFPILEGGVTKYNLKIYNRWGELLFESNRREIGWDGYFKNQLCKSDVYVFKLSVEFSDGKTLDKLGDVTLIR